MDVCMRSLRNPKSSKKSLTPNSDFFGKGDEPFCDFFAIFLKLFKISDFFYDFLRFFCDFFEIRKIAKKSQKNRSQIVCDVRNVMIFELLPDYFLKIQELAIFLRFFCIFFAFFLRFFCDFFTIFLRFFCDFFEEVMRFFSDFFAIFLKR